MNFPILSREQRLELLGAGILLLVVIGLVGWYMATHQAPEPYLPQAETPGTPVVERPEPQTVTEHAQFYDIEAAYPAETLLLASAGAKADATAIAAMKAFIDKTVSDFKREGNFANLTKEDLQIMGYEDGRKQALAIEYDETKGAHTVSYAYTIYVDTFGAHPNAFFRTFTFDTESGAELSIQNLFLPKTPYLARLSEISRTELTKTLGLDIDIKYMNEGTAPETKNFQSFTINGDALVLIFPPYQVGPYALGTQTVTIPLVQLKDILKAAYLP